MDQPRASEVSLAEHAIRSPFLSPVSATKSVLQQQTFEALLHERDRYWTVADLAQRLPGVAVNDVRIVLHLLLGDRLMDIEQAARQRSLALRLNEAGERVLADVLRGWAGTGRDER